MSFFKADWSDFIILFAIVYVLRWKKITHGYYRSVLFDWWTKVLALAMLDLIHVFCCRDVIVLGGGGVSVALYVGIQ